MAEKNYKNCPYFDEPGFCLHHGDYCDEWMEERIKQNKIKPMDRFILQEGKEPSTWVVTDTLNGIVIRFDEHRFNETQKPTLLVRVTDANKLAIAMREIGDWLAANHRDKVF